MSSVTQHYIDLDDHGRPWISGTQIKVVEVVLDHIASGFSPAEIHLQHPDLSLGQIHAALAYYFDHQTELDAEIQRQVADADRRRSQNLDSPGRRRLRSRGLLP